MTALVTRLIFFFQAEDGIRDVAVTGVQTCALPIYLFFILLIVLIIFGPGKLPELGKGLGKGIREFKDAMKGSMDRKDDGKKVEERKLEDKRPEDSGTKTS